MPNKTEQRINMDINKRLYQSAKIAAIERGLSLKLWVQIAIKNELENQHKVKKMEEKQIIYKSIDHEGIPHFEDGNSPQLPYDSGIGHFQE